MQGVAMLEIVYAIEHVQAIHSCLFFNHFRHGIVNDLGKALKAFRKNNQHCIEVRDPCFVIKEKILLQGTKVNVFVAKIKEIIFVDMQTKALG
jgi:hypothetical protein